MPLYELETFYKAVHNACRYTESACASASGGPGICPGVEGVATGEEEVLTTLVTRPTLQTVYSNLLYGGSDVARMLTDGGGKDAVRLFVQQVLRAYKAIRC